MATYLDATVAEAIIGYLFRSKGYLVQALTAAGAEEHNHDGNRRLAHLGSNLLRFILSLVAFEIVPSRSGITSLESSIISITQRASVAEKAGIDKCIKYSVKPGSRSPKVLALAIDAIVGAVYIDSTDFNTTWKVALKLGLVSANHAAISSSAIQPVPNMLNPSSSLFNHSPFVDDTEISSDPLFSANTQQNPGILSSDGFAEDGVVDAPISGSILSTPVNFLSRLEIPTTEESPSWTSLWRSSNEDQFNPENTIVIRGTQQEAYVVPGTNLTPDNLPPAARNSQEITAISSGQENDRVENENENPMEGQHYQARLLDDLLKYFFDEEDKKCRIHKFSLPFETFFAPSIQNALIGTGAQANTLAKILVYIASAESLVTLRQIVLSYRGRTSSISFETRPDLSEKERFNIIEFLGEKVAWCRLLRIYHILELYNTCGGTGRPGKLIITTPASFQSRKRKAGNPIHAAEAQITERMMEGIFPDLPPGTEGYKKKMAAIKPVRKLGQRLHILAAKFGNGVLGLILNDDMKGLGISEQMILSPSDNAFAKFIDILDRSQGSSLRRFSDAVQKMVGPLVHDALPSEPFTIENSLPEQILSLPKGSVALLEQIE